MYICTLYPWCFTFLYGKKTGFQTAAARFKHIFCPSFSSEHYYADITASLYMLVVAKEHSRGEWECFKPLQTRASSWTNPNPDTPPRLPHSVHLQSDPGFIICLSRCRSSRVIIAHYFFVRGNAASECCRGQASHQVFGISQTWFFFFEGVSGATN